MQKRFFSLDGNILICWNNKQKAIITDSKQVNYCFAVLTLSEEFLQFRNTFKLVVFFPLERNLHGARVHTQKGMNTYKKEEKGRTFRRIWRPRHRLLV